MQRDSRGGWAPLHELRHESDDSKFDAPPPGVFVFRIEESLSYPNAGYIAKQVRKLVEEYTARGSSTGSTASALWFTNPVSTLPTSDAIFGKGHSNNKPILRAIIFDFSAVNGIDATGLQILVDIRREVEKYAGRKVLFFFAHVHWQLQSVLHYFLANLDPNREVTPVTNATYSDPINQVEMKELEKERLECYGCESKFCALFIHRTIDQAIESADRQSQGGEFLDDNSTVTSPPAV